MPTFTHYVLSVPVEMLAVAVLALIGGVYAIRSVVHAARMRSDAFELTGRVSKTGWVAMLVVSAMVMFWNVFSLGYSMVTLVIIGWVIVGVYWGSKRTEMDDLLGFSQDGYGENWAR
ncbi:DUF2516 family protein [Lawsonella clevelandensis]|uniref:DUF2516 domain-containing protein n=1 Tax=Lawsonella clevelandensis TaxID=1528099 RepID=A0A0M3TBM0_9ACTN|nr:DUF2516 family protein [Lawsonella clevelandensis]ALE18854.1 hypothetical protein AL705_03350 [Lawsonella clevelandensis]ALE34527.1 hypothetical protein IY73_03225 [Lawsonella clevelandensis]MDU7193238.1 DUF2516 family protein [Lawsonella clevelandensis]VHO00317.1 hypothetical protein LC603019_00657 [Lawsonella clevelandensis]